MIRNRQEQTLFLDFSKIKCPAGSPSDIDMYYILPKGMPIFGEIKNGMGTFGQNQRWLYEKLANKTKGVVLYITHDKDVHKGDTYVDIATCQVVEYYFKGRWIRPRKYTTVNEAFEQLTEYEKARPI